MVTVGLHATAGAAGGDHPQTCTPGRITTALRLEARAKLKTNGMAGVSRRKTSDGYVM